MTSCGCAVPVDLDKPRQHVNFVKCPTSISGLKSDQVWIKCHSYLWHRIHNAICALEQRPGSQLPDWVDEFYTVSCPRMDSKKPAP